MLEDIKRAIPQNLRRAAKEYEEGHYNECDTLINSTKESMRRAAIMEGLGKANVGGVCEVE